MWKKSLKQGAVPECDEESSSSSSDDSDSDSSDSDSDSDGVPQTRLERLRAQYP